MLDCRRASPYAPLWVLSIGGVGIANETLSVCKRWPLRCASRRGWHSTGTLGTEALPSRACASSRRNLAYRQSLDFYLVDIHQKCEMLNKLFVRCCTSSRGTDKHMNKNL